MTKKKQSLREKRAEQVAQKKRQQRLYAGLGIVGVIIIIGLIAWVRQINAPSLEDVVVPEFLEAPPNAAGKAWGPEDAPVLIEEFSDFQ